MTEEERTYYIEDLKAFKENELDEYEVVLTNFTKFFTTGKVENIVADLFELLTSETYSITPKMDSANGKVKFVLEGANPIKVTVKFTKVDD